MQTAQRFGQLVLTLTALAYGLVALGALARTGVGVPVLVGGYQTVAVALGVLGLAGIVSGHGWWRQRPVMLAPLVALLAAAGLALAGGATTATLHAAVAAACGATYLALAVHSSDYRPSHAARSFFRSQWQVPLYAAVSVYGVMLFGSYLHSLGAEAACGGWPLCTGALPPAALVAHLLQRAAALLAGGLLLYTMAHVFRRHQHRPVLLALTGAAVVLFTVQVLLGAGAARGRLTPWSSAAHLVIAVAVMGTLTALAAVGYYWPSPPAIAGGAAAVATVPRTALEVLRDYVALTKPRILILLLITGYAAMWVAAGGPPAPGLTVLAMTGLAMSCGAANAINMWYDRDIDAIMSRTQRRPLPAGRVTPDQALSFGVMTGALSFVLLAVAVNLLTAVLALGGLLFYVLVYTMWLKRSTAQNIVIGGAAGAVPPLVGWAAVTGELRWAAVVMFLIVFLWTPPHFWALALFRNEDYRRAGVPMLPVVKGERHTKWQILLYSLAMVPATAALYWTGVVGQVYLWATTGLGLTMVAAAVMLLRERLPARRWAVRTFGWSVVWLGLVFLVMVLDVQR